MFIDVDLYPGLQIFRDNLEELKDSIIHDTFIRHPSWEVLNRIYRDPLQNIGWYSTALVVSNNVVKVNAEKYPFVMDLYEKLDVPNKLGIGFTKFEPGGYVKEHTDGEASYRYHLCLQSEENKAIITNGDKKIIYGVGKDYIINVAKPHSAFNKSETIERVNLVVDFVPDESMVENYQDYFGFGADWDGDGTF